MRSFVLALLLLAGCHGRELVPDCGDASYCAWALDGGGLAEICCPGDHPWCGAKRTDCPVGMCCDRKPTRVE